MEKPAARSRHSNPTMRYHSAFTLLEILIVSAIIVLFSGIILATYNNFNQQKNLESDVNKLVDVLSLAKSKAQSGDTYHDCTLSGSDEFSGYSVNVDTSNYNFQQCCRDISTKTQTSCGSSLQTYDFLINVNNSTGLTTINFFPLAEGASPATLEIRNSLINKCASIDIALNGLITTSDIYSC